MAMAMAMAMYFNKLNMTENPISTNNLKLFFNRVLNKSYVTI